MAALLIAAHRQRITNGAPPARVSVQVGGGRSGGVFPSTPPKLIRLIVGNTRRWGVTLGVRVSRRLPGVLRY